MSANFEQRQVLFFFFLSCVFGFVPNSAQWTLGSMEPKADLGRVGIGDQLNVHSRGMVELGSEAEAGREIAEKGSVP